MYKRKISKVIALIVAGMILNGAVVFGAFATPDEWFPSNGQYLDFEEDEAKSLSEESVGQYIVSAGDNLISIASKLGCRQSDLVAINKISNPGLIKEGQLLTIPGPVNYHSVSPGETLTWIAKKFEVSVEQLIATNSINDKDHLYPGQKLIIVSGADKNAKVSSSSSRGLVNLRMDSPVVGWISSPFGERDGRPHEGVDIAANMGDPIKASMAGEVIYADSRGTYGLTVILDHGDGITTLYAHCSQLLVKKGQRVKQGDKIAKVGNTGRSTGPHLHMEVRSGGIPYDPMVFIDRMRA